MTDLFLRNLNLSISASFLVLAIAALRLCLKKAPKWVWPVLWGLVALRLVLPVSIESRVSMIPDPAPVSREAIVAYAPPIQLETPVDRQTNTVNAASGSPVEVATEIRPDQVMAMVWLAGAAGMVLYTAVSYISLRWKIGRAQKLRKNIFESRNVGSPFVLGLFMPRIYLPVGLGEDEQFYILAHEQAHIRRGDHLWKPLGFTLLAVHWFNPVMWLAYVLLCRDIELACDEKVIKQLGREGRADYSQALLSCAVRHRSIAACPLAFGEVGVKQRVKSVLNYKKPTFWVVLAAVAASVVVAVCFMTNPRQAEKGRLTLEEVLALTEKGKITDADLEGYEFEHDYGDPLYIYPLEEDFELWVYKAEGELRVFRLQCNAGEAGDGSVDITNRAYLDAFLTLHNQPLSEGWDRHDKFALELGDTTPTGAHLYVSSYNSEVELPFACVEGYAILTQDRWGHWVELPQKIPPAQEDQETDRALLHEEDIDWTERYGVLPDGAYKLIKEIHYSFAGVDIRRGVTADFTVRVEGRPQLTTEEFLNRKKFVDEGRWITNDLEAYNAAHRNAWADYEDFAYVEEINNRLGWRSRCYQMDNSLIMSMNGPMESPRPSNIGLSNGIASEWLLTDWIDSREALAYAIDLFSQPLPEGQLTHMSAQLVMASFSPTGATVALVTSHPEKITVRPESICYLEQLDKDGNWIPVPSLDGGSRGGINFPTTGPTTLRWDWRHGALPAGTYRISLNVTFCYDDGGEILGRSTIQTFNVTAAFTIGESQAETLAAQARPFDPGEVHDLTQAVLCVGEAEYVLTEKEDLGYLESLFSKARGEKGIPGCPFSSTAYLVRGDGTVLSFQHAEDSCQALMAGDTCYTYDIGLGRDFWETFGIAQSYSEFVYDEQGRVIQQDAYEWGRRVPNSTKKFTYDQAGNLSIAEWFDDDGTTRWKEINSYDDRGNLVQWHHYLGEKGGEALWTRGERTYGENNNLTQEVTYRGEELTCTTLYSYDEKGRLLEIVNGWVMDSDTIDRYEWEDDHHYRVNHLDTNENLLHTDAYVTDEEGRVIRREFFSKYGGSEGFEEYEYVEGNDAQMIVRYYDQTGTLTEEGWGNID